MSHLPFALTAYFFNAISTTVDKFLLTKSVAHPLVYLFYLCLFSLIGLAPLPFTHFPPMSALIFASVAMLIWLAGAYTMFFALKIGQVTRVIPMIGTLIPIFLLIDASLTQAISSTQLLAVLLLTAGIVFLTIMDWRGSLSKNELLLTLLSSLFYAISYVALREAYLQTDFLSAFAWSRFVFIPVILLILLIPSWKRIVFAPKSDQPAFKLLSKPGLLMISGQAAGGLSEILIMFSISLANPALVNSLQGTQYAFLFFFALILSKRYPNIFHEKFTIPILLTKIIGIFLITGGLYLLAKQL